MLTALPDVDGVGSPGERWAAWVGEFVVIPRGVGSGQRMRARPYQTAVVDALLEDETRLALWVAARGAAKSGTAASVGLHHIMEPGELGRTCAILCTSEESAARILRWATRAVELSPELDSRISVFRDRLVVPATGSELKVLAARVAAIEGEDLSLLIVDELGFVERDCWASAWLSLKRPGARCLAIGTPPKPSWRDRSPMLDLVVDARLGLDSSTRLIEHTSDLSHEVDCVHCWRSANPSLGDLLDESQLRASLPPKTSEGEYRRARLAQWIETDTESFLAPSLWSACAVAGSVPDRAEVCLGLDGSFNGDTTALVVASIGAKPHLDVVGLWQAPGSDPDWRVPIVEVEQAVLDAAKRWRVKELTADPYRWQRSLEVLAAAGVTTSEHPQTAQRMSPLTSSFREAVVNGELTHSGDRELARHMSAAVLRDDLRGVRITKPSKSSTRRIDLAVAALMAYGRATHYSRHPVRRSRGLVLDHRKRSA